MTTTRPTVPPIAPPCGGPPRRPRHERSTFQAVVAELSWWSIGRRGEDVVARWRAAGVGVGGCLDPLELAQAARRDPSRWKDAIAALCGLARRDHLAALCVAAALVPRLAHDVRWLSRFGLDRDDAEGAVLVALWEVMAEGGRTDPAALVRRTHNALRRELRAGRSAVPPRRSVPVSEAVEPQGADALGLLLFDAQRAGVLSAGQVALLADAHLSDKTDAAIAAECGRVQEAVKKARQRAERSLVAFVRGTDQ